MFCFPRRYDTRTTKINTDTDTDTDTAADTDTYTQPHTYTHICAYQDFKIFLKNGEQREQQVVPRERVLDDGGRVHQARPNSIKQHVATGGPPHGAATAQSNKDAMPCSREVATTTDKRARG